MNKMKLIVSGIVIATSMVAVSGTVSAAAPVMGKKLYEKYV